MSLPAALERPVGLAAGNGAAASALGCSAALVPGAEPADGVGEEGAGALRTVCMAL
jgi:hypothetical protein